MSIRRFLFKILIGVFALSISINAFHKYHTSLTVMEYNADEKLIEITIQLFTHDLLPVLEKNTRKTFDLEKNVESDEILLDYLNENFVLNRDDKSAGKLVWVGKETKVDRVYIYAEIPFGGDFGKLELKNTIFFESFGTQTNLVTFHFGESKADLLFKPKDTFKEIRFTQNTKN